MREFNYPEKSRYARIDGWRGYGVPRFAIIGASDTGEYEDSPAPSRDVKAEIRRFQREVLRPLGIKSRQRFGNSSNVFCAKRWLIVPRGSFCAAARAADEWLRENRYTTRFVHDAELDQLAI